jgi:hypothetical protein
MSKPTTPLAQFSRDPVLRNSLKRSATDAGDSFTVPTPELIAAYRRWLYLEHRMLWDEGPGPSPITKMPSTDGLSASDAVKVRFLVEDQQRRELQCMAKLSDLFRRLDPSSPVDHYFTIASPASTRAALVLRAVGCDEGLTMEKQTLPSRRARRPCQRPGARDPARCRQLAPLAECGKCLKTLKTARAGYWLKLAWIWDRRDFRLGSAPFCYPLWMRRTRRARGTLHEVGCHPSSRSQRRISSDP